MWLKVGDAIKTQTETGEVKLTITNVSIDPDPNTEMCNVLIEVYQEPLQKEMSVSFENFRQWLKSAKWEQTEPTGIFT